jgi:hypothetical protein
MAKPTNTPRWANVSGDIVEPSSDKKDVGFISGERPPAQFLNWLLNLLYQWIAWLNDIVAPSSGSEALSISSAGTLGANGKHGDRPFAIHACAGSGTGAAISSANGWFATSADGEWWIPLRFNVGDRIRSLVAWADDTGDSLTVQLYRISSAGVRVSVAGPSGSSGAWGSGATLASIDHTILADNAYFAVLNWAAAAVEFVGVKGVFDRP